MLGVREVEIPILLLEHMNLNPMEVDRFLHQDQKDVPLAPQWRI